MAVPPATERRPRARQHGNPRKRIMGGRKWLFHAFCEFARACECDGLLFSLEHLPAGGEAREGRGGNKREEVLFWILNHKLRVHVHSNYDS